MRKEITNNIISNRFNVLSFSIKKKQDTTHFMFYRVLFVFFSLLFFTSFTFAQQKLAKDYPSEIAIKWFDFQLEIIPATTGFSPPVTARALGYSGLTLYESLVHGMPNNESLLGKLNGFAKLPLPKKDQSYNWGIVANKAQFEIIRFLYSNLSAENKSKAEKIYQEIQQKIALRDNEKTIRFSNEYGEEIAKAIYEYSKKDGGHNAQFSNFPKEYKLATGACMWIPVGNQQAMLPFWGENRTFIKGNADFDLPIPPRCEIGNTSLFYAQALEVYTIGKNLTQEQKDIALFWSDDPGKTFTPPGHGVSILSQLIKVEGIPLDKAAELFCKVGIAASDAFVSCWKCKYMHNISRPVSFINTAIDPKWKSFLDNPPFPEYTSGHASVSGAIATVLSEYFGYNYSFIDNSHKTAGLKPRTFDSFWEFAQEAAMSRLYGGIHYRNSNDEGLKNGKRIGKMVNQLSFQKTNL